MWIAIWLEDWKEVFDHAKEYQKYLIAYVEAWLKQDMETIYDDAKIMKPISDRLSKLVKMNIFKEIASLLFSEEMAKEVKTETVKTPMDFFYDKSVEYERKAILKKHEEDVLKVKLFALHWQYLRKKNQDQRLYSDRDSNAARDDKDEE